MDGALSSGVIRALKRRKRAIHSACVINVPLAAYRSVRHPGVTRVTYSTVAAFSYEASILPWKVRNQATVMSVVQHLADDFVPLSTGLNSCVHLEAKE